MNGAFTALKSEAATSPPAGQITARERARGAPSPSSPTRPGTLAPRLAALLQPAGYGVTVVPWEQLDKAAALGQTRRAGRRPTPATLPVAARDQLVAASQCSGKVMCLGAPALSTLLARAPDGWLPRGAVAQRLRQEAPAPAHRDQRPSSWQRATRCRPARRHRRLTRASGPTAWKVTSDLKGWDTWRVDVGQALRRAAPVAEPSRPRAIATTRSSPSSATRADGSRWIGVVDLATDWQTLRPACPATSPTGLTPSPRTAAAAGDRLQPENVTGHHLRPGLQPHRAACGRARTPTGSATSPPPTARTCPQPNFQMPASRPCARRTSSTRWTRSRSCARPRRSASRGQPVAVDAARLRAGLARAGPRAAPPPAVALGAAPGRRRRHRPQARRAGLADASATPSTPTRCGPTSPSPSPRRPSTRSSRPRCWTPCSAMTRGCFLLEGGAELFSLQARRDGHRRRLGHQPQPPAAAR